MQVNIKKNKFIILVTVIVLFSLSVFATVNTNNPWHPMQQIAISDSYKTISIADAITVTNSLNVGIGKSPTQKLDVNGNVKANAFYYSSDINLKKDIVQIGNPLDKINQLKGVSFTWKNDNKKSIGLIAQDVEKVFPELVLTDENTGLKSLQYGNLVAVLIEAVKEQQKQINELKKEIEELKG